MKKVSSYNAGCPYFNVDVLLPTSPIVKMSIFQTVIFAIIFITMNGHTYNIFKNIFKKGTATLMICMFDVKDLNKP